MGASVVAGVDAPPVFEASEHVLDPVTGFVEFLVIGDLLDAVRFRRDAGRNAARQQGGAQPIGVVAFVADQGLGVRQPVDDEGRALEIDIWPSVSSKMSGRPLSSQTACNFEFRPPLVRPATLAVRPIWRGRAPFFAGSMPCGGRSASADAGLSGVWRRSSKCPAFPPPRPSLRRCG